MPLTHPVESESHLVVLRLLQAHPDYSQRQLAETLGLSLGKVHYVLTALLETGMVKVKNFKRSNHKLGYVYVLTPRGVRHRALLTRAFLARKESQYDSLKREIDLLRREVNGSFDSSGASGF